MFPDFKSFYFLDQVSKTRFSNGAIHIETYLMDFHENIYDEKLQIQFCHWLRKEVKFDNPRDLILQMEQDVIKAKKLIYKKTKS